MSTTPPPFGDPTNIEREHASAVGKGVGCGCGGCLAAVVGCFVLGAAIFAFVMMLLRGSDACQMSLHQAQHSEVMKRELGEPISLGWLVFGNIHITNGNGSVDVTVPVSGPKGSASIHTVGTKSSGGPWTFSTMQAKVDATGEVVDLRAP